MNALRAIAIITILWGTGCSKPLSTANWGNRLKVAQMRSVAVLPFESVSSDQSASDVVTNLFATALYSTGRFSVMEKNEAVRKLKAAKLTLPTVIDREAARQAGKLLGVEGVFVGTITEYAYLFYPEDAVVGFQVSLIDTDSGQVVWNGLYSDRNTGLLQGDDAPISGLAKKGVMHLVADLTPQPNDRR